MIQSIPNNTKTTFQEPIRNFMYLSMVDPYPIRTFTEMTHFQSVEYTNCCSRSPLIFEQQ